MRNLSAQLLATALTLTLLTDPVTAESAMALDKAMVKVWAQTISLLDDKKYYDAQNYLNAALSTVKHDKARTLSIYICMAELALQRKNSRELDHCIKRAKSLAKELSDNTANIKLQDLEADYYCDLKKDYKNGLPLRRQVATALEHLLGRKDFRPSLYLFKLEKAYRELGMSKEAKETKTEADNRIVNAMNDIEAQIRRNWHPARFTTSKHCKFLFKINEEGKAFDVKISAPSGDGQFDQSCLQSIEKFQLENFERWDFNFYFQEVDFSFDYNVFNGADGDKHTEVSLADLDTYYVLRQQLDMMIEQLSARSADATFSQDQELILQYEIFNNLMSLKYIDQAKTFINKLLLHPKLSPRAQILIKGESALLLEQEKKSDEAEALLKEAIESPDFDKLPKAEMKRTFLYTYGDLLYERNQKEEARKIYNRIPPLH